MKKAILLLLLSCCIFIHYSSTLENKSDLLLVDGLGISVYLEDESQHKLFDYAEYSNEYENVIFETKKVMNFVEIYNSNGKKQFQIPLDSKYLQLSKKKFEKGKYRMGIKFKNKRKVQNIHIDVIK